MVTCRTAWVLPENAPVIAASDFIGHNAFPYFETTKPNAIEQAVENFWSALRKTDSVAGGKPVFVAETGWPSSEFRLLLSYCTFQSQWIDSITSPC